MLAMKRILEIIESHCPLIFTPSPSPTPRAKSPLASAWPLPAHSILREPIPLWDSSNYQKTLAYTELKSILLCLLPADHCPTHTYTEHISFLLQMVALQIYPLY